MIYCANIRIDNTHLHKLDIVLLKSQTAVIKGVGFYLARALLCYVCFFSYKGFYSTSKPDLEDRVYKDVGFYATQKSRLEVLITN